MPLTLRHYYTKNLTVVLTLYSEVTKEKTRIKRPNKFAKDRREDKGNIPAREISGERL